MPGFPNPAFPAAGLWIGTLARTSLWWTCATVLLLLQPSGAAGTGAFAAYVLVVSPAAVVILSGMFIAARLRLGLSANARTPHAAARLFTTLEIALTIALAAASATSIWIT